MAKDLTPIDLSELTWEDGKRAACLEQVYDRVTAQATSAITWYQSSRNPKKWMATLLRWGAVVLVSISGLLPLISNLMEGGTLKDPAINPLYTSLALAVAAALFGLDKFLNFSTGWMRYVKTGCALRTALSEFEFEWLISRAAWAGPEPTAEQAADMLARCKAFGTRVNTIVADETNVWITKFQASLAQLGESVKAAEARVEADAAKRAEAAQTGALNVVVRHDGKTFAGPIRLRVNDNQGVYLGPNVALVGLPAGPNRLAAEFEENGKTHRGEISVDVVPGKTSPASVETAAVA